MVVIECCWSQVDVGARLHSMLDLDWILTRPPLVSRFNSYVYAYERNLTFVILGFNYEGYLLLYVFIEDGIGVLLCGSMWFGNPSC